MTFREKVLIVIVPLALAIVLALSAPAWMKRAAAVKAAEDAQSSKELPCKK
jgi:hypothetical protein